MREFLYYTIMIALVAAFVLSLLRKWGFIEWIQVHGNNFFANMFSCNFCLSFWFGLVLSILCVFISGDLTLLLVPVCSTTITRNLL